VAKGTKHLSHVILRCSYCSIFLRSSVGGAQETGEKAARDNAKKNAAIKEHLRMTLERKPQK
jgi:hypothetical protein